ncbi:MAG: porin [Pseudomonadota bacterium]
MNTKLISSITLTGFALTTLSAAAEETTTPPAKNAFNPQISFIFDGAYYSDNQDGEGYEWLEEIPGIQGEGHSHEGEEEHAHGELSEGFNLREQELVMTAAIDPNLDGSVFLAISEDEIEIEEAFFTTRGLPGGLQLKAGKFLSSIGYLNNKHVHTWDFVDQNLAYLSLLGDHGLNDTGLQVTWLPKTPFYTQLGIEWFQGDEQERLGLRVEEEEEREELGLDELETGPSLLTAFVKVSPDLGFYHNLQAGLWFADSQQDQNIVEVDEEETGLEGDAQMWGVDFIYKYDSQGDYGRGDAIITAEYMSLEKDWNVTNGDLAGTSAKGEQDAFYAQGVYYFAPRWMAGLRYDSTGLTNDLTGGGLDESFDESNRVSLLLSWVPTEFSRIRLQYSQADIAGEDDDLDQLFLQFTYSLGSHGAHQF